MRTLGPEEFVCTLEKILGFRRQVVQKLVILSYDYFGVNNYGVEVGASAEDQMAFLLP